MPRHGALQGCIRGAGAPVPRGRAHGPLQPAAPRRTPGGEGVPCAARLQGTRITGSSAASMSMHAVPVCMQFLQGSVPVCVCAPASACTLSTCNAILTWLACQSLSAAGPASSRSWLSASLEQTASHLCLQCLCASWPLFSSPGSVHPSCSFMVICPGV